jgi:hypothetical protein
VGRNSAHETVLYSKIKELITLLEWRCSKPKFIIIPHPHSHANVKIYQKFGTKKIVEFTRENKDYPSFLVEKQQKDSGKKVLSCLL